MNKCFNIAYFHAYRTYQYQRLPPQKVETVYMEFEVAKVNFINEKQIQQGKTFSMISKRLMKHIHILNFDL